MRKRDPYLIKAIEACGNSAKLATVVSEIMQNEHGCAPICKRCKISRQGVAKWKEVPARRVLAVVAACDGAVKDYELRPDVYKHNVA